MLIRADILARVAYSGDHLALHVDSDFTVRPNWKMVYTPCRNLFMHCHCSVDHELELGLTTARMLLFLGILNRAKSGSLLDHLMRYEFQDATVYLFAFFLIYAAPTGALCTSSPSHRVFNTSTFVKSPRVRSLFMRIKLASSRLQLNQRHLKTVSELTM